MDILKVTAWLKIHEGKLAEFKSIVVQVMKTVKTKDPGTVQYDMYYNAEETVCVVKEKYKDSAAFLAHLGNMGELLGKLGLVSELTFEVYGNPTEELRAVILGANAKIFSFYEGL
jgi:quinol monooxygenase YgiN